MERQEENNVFRDWVPNWLIRVILIYCLMPSLMLMGLYSSNVTYTASYLDVEPEDMQFIMSIAYGVLLATVLIEGRFFRYFSTRNYIMSIQGLISLMLILSAYTHNFYQFLVLRVAEGFLMALPGVTLRKILLSRFGSKNAVIIVYSFFYGMLLVSSTITVHVMVWILDRYDWKYMVFGGAFFQILGMGLVLLIFNSNRFVRKFPLYQIDWFSYILLVTGILCGAFVLCYGEKKYWFESWQIIGAAIIALVFMGLFMLRQLGIKRPAFQMEVLQDANVRIGVFLFLIFYITRATLNMCHSTMSRVWNWEPIRVAHVQYINVAGIITGLFLSGMLQIRGTAVRYLLSIGFFCITIYLLWFTFLFVPDISLQQLAIPYCLQGVGVGFIFIPLVLFTTSSLPSSLLLSGGFVGVSGRFWGTMLGFAILQTSQANLQRDHYSKLQQFVSPESVEAQSRMAAATQSFIARGYNTDQAARLALQQLNNAVAKQSILLSNMEIFTVMGYIMAGLTILILLNQHIKHSFVAGKETALKLFPRIMW